MTTDSASPTTVAPASTVSNAEDTASTITVNTKTFPPPKTDKPRPHVCQTCQRSFARLEHLKRHERSHTKEKPFECPECTRCFARRDLLLRHQQKLHQTTTPSSRPRNRRESTSSAAPGQSRARKNSIIGNASAGGAGAGAANSMRPRANTISHVDGAAMQMMAAATVSVARGAPPTHSRHPSLAGLPMHHNMDHGFGMSASLGHRGMPHGLPKLETHGVNNMDFSSGLRTAPILPQFNNDFDFESILFGPGPTINPNALHYNDSPQSMALDPLSPFSHGLHDMPASQQIDDSFDWLTGFEHQMSFSNEVGGNDNSHQPSFNHNHSNHVGGAMQHENAIDGSSPSAISTTSQSGISDVMVDGSNHPAAVSSAITTSMWQPGLMAPPQLTNPFALDLGGVFPDLMNGAPVSPQPPTQNNVADAYFSTPPPSLSSLSPTIMSGVNTQNLNHTLKMGTGPETPSSMNGSNHGTSPVSTITDSTRNAILGALSSASSLGSPLGGRTFSFSSPHTPMSPLGQTAANNTGLPENTIPSTQDLQRYVGAYLRYFHPHLPFLHLPTLSFDAPSSLSAGRSDALGGCGCLILSMAAIGALYEMEHDQSRQLFGLAKKMIQIYLDERRKANVRKADFRRSSLSEQHQSAQPPENSVDTPVWLVQAMLLNVVYGHNCADKRAGEIASTHCTALVSLAQGADLFRPTRSADHDTQDVTMDGVETAWRGDGRSESETHAQWMAWKTTEERKRTLYAVFIMSSLLVTAYNHTPALTNSEILLDLPCDEEFFNAETSAAFAAKGGSAAANHNRMTFHDALGDLLRTKEKQQRMTFGNASHQAFGPGVSPNDVPGADLRPSTFGCLVLINALHNYIWETRQRHHNKVWTNEETEKMHRHIEPALKAWQTAWASNPDHSLERPNPHGQGPLSADAIPLLDLAYVRLFVNLARSKEKFWQRDWDGLAEELSRGTEIIQHAEHSPSSNQEASGMDLLDDLRMNLGQLESPSGQGQQTDFVTTPNGTRLHQQQQQQQQQPQSQSSTNRATSRREKHLRKAAFYAADSLAMSDKLGVTFADYTSRELPLQSAMCAFDCAQVLAEWIATLQDRVGRYLGILGQDNVDLAQVPAIMLLEEEDVKLLGKVEEVLGGAEIKMSLERGAMGGGGGGGGGGGEAGGGAGGGGSEQHVGFAAKILRVTAHMLGKAAVWPVTHLMAECLENHACHIGARAQRSVVACD